MNDREGADCFEGEEGGGWKRESHPDLQDWVPGVRGGFSVDFMCHKLLLFFVRFRRVLFPSHPGPLLSSIPDDVERRKRCSCQNRENVPDILTDPVAVYQQVKASVAGDSPCNYPQSA